MRKLNNATAPAQQCKYASSTMQMSCKLCKEVSQQYPLPTPSHFGGVLVGNKGLVYFSVITRYDKCLVTL